MDIKQLRYFLTIAEEGQITAAAKKLQMAQPPLSQQLKLLEDELGVKLAERGPRSIQLTDAGVMLQRRAQQIVALADSTSREIRDIAKGLSGTLQVGTVSSSGAALLTDRLIEFHQTYEGVKFEIHEGNTFHIIDLLESGVIEIGIVRTPFHTGGLNWITMKQEPMIAVMAPRFDWNVAAESCSMEELQGRPLIIYRRFESLIRETCEKAGFEPEFFCKNDDARTTLQWAHAGLGIGIIPESALRLSNHSGLHVKTIRSEPLRTQIAAIWSKERYLSTLAKRFIDSFGENK